MKWMFSLLLLFAYGVCAAADADDDYDDGCASGEHWFCVSGATAHAWPAVPDVERSTVEAGRMTLSVPPQWVRMDALLTRGPAMDYVELRRRLGSLDSFGLRGVVVDYGDDRKLGLFWWDPNNIGSMDMFEERLERFLRLIVSADEVPGELKFGGADELRMYSQGPSLQAHSLRYARPMPLVRAQVMRLALPSQLLEITGRGFSQEELEQIIGSITLRADQ